MGHMDDDEDRYTVTVRYKSDATPETFNRCTNVDTDHDEITFDDDHGHHHQFCGVSYHVVAEQ